jgi:DNA mismatch repair ATPase MutS
MKIYTSMRIADSLEENMSTFKAELVRIASIVKASSEEESMLFLIDEVFRGTNSQDRTDGAEILLRKLDRPYISGFMTTHDYALCDRVAEQKMPNIIFCHFSERYEDDEVIFDYKLRDGMSHESNAKFLMKLVGII